MLRREIFYWVTESLLTVQNNAERTIYIKANLVITHENNKYKLCDNKDKIVTHTGECNRLAQKGCQKRHKKVRKVICWEMYKKTESRLTNNGIQYTIGQLSSKLLKNGINTGISPIIYI